LKRARFPKNGISILKLIMNTLDKLLQNERISIKR
jgi:hypothetical protein